MGNFATFCEAMKDKGMYDELTAIITDKKPANRDALVQVVFDFAVSKGFEVKKEELIPVFATSEELSVKELEGVSGGGFFSDLWNLLEKGYQRIVDDLTRQDNSVIDKVSDIVKDSFK